MLSVVQVSSADGGALIDTRTEMGTKRPVLKNPPARVVMPAEVWEIEWKPKKGRPLKLRYVWILSNEKSTFPVGGVLFLPFLGPHIFHLVTFNTGSLEDRTCTNVHHAEMHATGSFPDRKGFIEAQPKLWQSRVGAINIWNLSRKKGLGYSPCNYCCEDLARFLTNLRALGPSTARRASITWLNLYDRNKPCGHPTDTANLRKLDASGWVLKGEGWPPKSTPSSSPSRVRVAR